MASFASCLLLNKKIRMQVKILDFDLTELGSMSIKLERNAFVSKLKKSIVKKSKNTFSLASQRLYLNKSQKEFEPLNECDLKLIDLDHKQLNFYDIEHKSIVYLKTGHELKIVLTGAQSPLIEQFSLDVEASDKISNVMAKFMIKYPHIKLKYYHLYRFSNEQGRQMIKADVTISSLSIHQTFILELETIERLDYQYFSFY